MQADAIKPGQNVVIIDDLVATGMTHSLLATVSSVEAHDKRGYRWFCESGWRACGQARREDPRIPLHYRAHFPQRYFEARRACILDHQGR